MKMKALIIEDETAAARNLAAILRQAAPEVEVVATLESVAESIEWLRANPEPELLFMDIHLADGDSFRIFDAVEITAPVIFTTAYDRYALEAFKVNSIDYLLKPLNEADVRRALAKLRRLTSAERSSYGSRVRSLASGQRDREEVFLVHVRDRIIPLQRDRIAYCYTANERVTACERARHGLRLRRCGLPAGPDARNAAIHASRGGVLPGQPSVHRGAAGREGDRRVVREPAVAASDGRDPRADHHLEGPGSGIQGLAAVGSPRGIGG